MDARKVTAESSTPPQRPKDEAAQIRDQYLAIAHMARQIAHVHEQLAPCAESLPARVCGPDSARLLETLGDIMNGMDIVEKGDDWVSPILLKAHEMYPQVFIQSEKKAITGLWDAKKIASTSTLVSYCQTKRTAQKSEWQVAFELLEEAFAASERSTCSATTASDKVVIPRYDAGILLQLVFSTCRMAAVENDEREYKKMTGLRSMLLDALTRPEGL